jgi:hypothetical protein
MHNLEMTRDGMYTGEDMCSSDAPDLAVPKEMDGTPLSNVRNLAAVHGSKGIFESSFLPYSPLGAQALRSVHEG